MARCDGDVKRPPGKRLVSNHLKSHPQEGLLGHSLDCQRRMAGSCLGTGSNLDEEDKLFEVSGYRDE